MAFRLFEASVLANGKSDTVQFWSNRQTGSPANILDAGKAYAEQHSDEDFRTIKVESVRRISYSEKKG